MSKYGNALIGLYTVSMSKYDNALIDLYTVSMRATVVIVHEILTILDTRILIVK